ncbi:thermostable hemolysin [Streptomyces sp. G44]|uniref:thermostable hemolysin n=1 Tax=Streptomyces sp. G44 TaxID=2807632 RepID=UPI0019603890|nr:thermostable hemolysin [Streptomyces sp. G44]MBM7169475.1 thermostable hemolysin [Streptomyces sp. G44]
MSLGVVARRENVLWRASIHLARTVYREKFGADIDPSPDLFAALQHSAPDQGPADDAPLGAVAGMTFAGNAHLLSEYYLAGSVEAVLAPRIGQRLQRSEIVEVGPLAATTNGDGAQLCSLLPLLTWCNGAKAVVCTVTPRLSGLLNRMGIDFVPLVPARENALPRRLQGDWGSYYESSPVTGYIDLRSVGQRLTDGAFAPAPARRPAQV